MSRRQRLRSNPQSTSSKKGGSKKGVKTQRNKKNPSLRWKILAVSVLILLVVIVIFYQKAYAYLHSKEFNRVVAERVSSEIGCEGTFGDFKWNGFSGKNETYSARGEGAVSEVMIKDLALDVDFSWIKRDVFDLTAVKIGSIHSVIDLNLPFIKHELVKREPSFIEKLLPATVKLNDAQVDDVTLKVLSGNKTYEIQGVSARVHQEGKGYLLEATGGSVDLDLPLVGALDLDHVKMKQRGQQLFLNESRFKIADSGQLQLSGMVDLSPSAIERYSFKGEVKNLQTRDVIAPNWKKVLMGELRSHFTVKPYKNDLPLITGKAALINGSIEALPMLNKVAYYLADPKYRSLKLDQLNCDYEQFQDETVISNIVLESLDLLKIEGDLQIKGVNLKGRFNVGLPASKLRHIPGAETIVFKPGKDGLYWTVVNISGTFENLEEDLSERLMSAAGQRMVQIALDMGGEVLKPDNIKKLLAAPGTAIDVIGGKTTIPNAIDGLLGKDPQRTSDDEKGEGAGEGGIIPDLPVIPEIPKILEINKILPF